MKKSAILSKTKMFTGKAIFPVIFLMLLGIYQAYAIYKGPADICYGIEGFSSFFPGWCSYNNPHAYRPSILGDVYPILPTNFTYECTNSSDFADCTSIVGIRAMELRFFDSTLSSVIVGTSSGKVLLIELLTQQVLDVDVTTPQTIVKIDAISLLAVSLAKSTVTNNYMLAFFDLQKITGVKIWSKDYSPNLIVKDTKLFYDYEADYPVIMSLIVDTTKSYTSGTVFLEILSANSPEAPIYWRIETDVDKVDKLKFQVIKHVHNMDSTQRLRIPAIPELGYDDDTPFKVRQLVLLNDEEQVRICEYQTGVEATIVMNKKDDLDAARTTFFRLSDEDKQSGHKITAVNLMTETIRRPINLVNSTTCGNVQYGQGQNTFLMTSVYNSNTDESIMKIAHIPEFLHINQGQTRAILNPANRPEAFNCQPGQYLSESGCADVTSTLIGYSGQAIQIESRFADANITLNSVPSYKDDGAFNPPAVCELVKSFIINPFAKDPAYQGCVAATNTSTCELDVLNGNIDENYLHGFFYLYWQTQIFVAKTTKEVSIYATAMRFDTQGDLLIKDVNKIQTLGNVLDMNVAPNSHHLFLAVSRQKWELDAMKRYIEVCLLLYYYPDNPLLRPFIPKCLDPLLGPKLIDLSQFTTVASSVNFGQYVPSISDYNVIDKVPNGVFLHKAYSALPCLPGSFCRGGILIDCPPGFSCRRIGLSYPESCGRDDSMKSTCYVEALREANAPCPDGFICKTSFFAPINVPPGYWLKKITNNQTVIQVDGLQACDMGDYCPLGAEIDIDIHDIGTYNKSSLLCPGNTYCPNATVLVPTVCTTGFDKMDYCPPGTAEPARCPAGYYCTRPDQKAPCSLTQYCPEGSFASQVCPGGHYCVNASTKAICPAGYFCRAGSIQPVRCAIWYSWFACPQGTEYNKLLPLGFITNLLIIVVFLILNVIIMIIVKCIRERAKQRVTNRAQALERYASLDENPHLRAKKFTVDLGFEKLGLQLFNGKKVLNGVTGEIKHGQLTAVMGCSGSGKTTFITTLSGRAYYGSIQGKIFINGKESNLNKYNSIIGFVPQEDVMIRELTVEETLYIAAMNKLGGSTDVSKIRDIVDNVIDVLGLKKIRYSVIGDEEKRGISGGERKRVNVGIELVSEPSILFLDEPTSGLDSSKSKEVCHALQRIAESGLTVITVIHQPRHEIFEMFQNLLLLGEGGRTIYLGNTKDAVKYFESLGFMLPPNLNPADFLLDVTSGHISSAKYHYSQLADIWEQRTRQQTANLQKQKKVAFTPRGNKIINIIVQFFVCLLRSFIQQIRDFRGLFVDNFLVFISGFVLGIMFINKSYQGPVPTTISDLCPGDLKEVCTLPVADPIINSTAMLTLAMSLIAAMASLRAFGSEKIVFQRESQSGLSTVSYFLAKDLSLLPSIALSPLIMLSLYYGFIAPRAPFWEYYVVLALTYWATYGIGYIVSIIVPPHIAQLTAVVVIFVFNVISGTTPTLPDFEEMGVPMKYAPIISYLRYSKEAAYVSEIRQYSNVYDITRSLKLLGYHLDSLPALYGYIAIFGVVFRVLALITLICYKPQSSFNTMRVYIRYYLSAITNWRSSATNKAELANDLNSINHSGEPEQPTIEHLPGTGGSLNANASVDIDNIGKPADSTEIFDDVDEFLNTTIKKGLDYAENLGSGLKANKRRSQQFHDSPHSSMGTPQFHINSNYHGGQHEEHEEEESRKPLRSSAAYYGTQ